jgi:cardiolipin synthase
VQIYEFQEALLHAKTAMIDGVWSTVGSSNLDWRSFSDNDEVNAIVLGHEFAMQMQAEFEQDLASSRAIDPKQWKRRSPLLRVKEGFATLWQRLL